MGVGLSEFAFDSAPKPFCEMKHTRKTATYEQKINGMQQHIPT